MNLSSKSPMLFIFTFFAVDVNADEIFLGSPVIVNGDEFENIELKHGMDCHQADAIEQSYADVKRDFDNNNSEDNRIAGKMAAGSVPPLATGAFALDLEKQRDSSGYASESGDMLRELVKNKELMEVTKKKSLTKTSSMESDISDSSLMVSCIECGCRCQEITC